MTTAASYPARRAAGLVRIAVTGMVLCLAAAPRGGWAFEGGPGSPGEKPGVSGQPAAPADRGDSGQPVGEGELLTLDEAVAMAVRGSVAVENARLQVDIRRRQLDAVKTEQLPNFGVAFLGDLRVTGPPTENDEFQNLPDIGGGATFVDPSNRATALLGARAVQQILGLHRVHLQMRLRRALVDTAEEEVGRLEQGLAANVAATYHDLVQIQQAVVANEASLRFYTELERTVAGNVQEGNALLADLLDVRARAAAERSAGTKLRNAFVAGQETLNRQIGRDVLIRFRVSPMPETPLASMDEEELRAQALERRPEVRQGELAVRQATITRRLAQAEFIPTLNLGFTFFRPLNSTVLTNSIGTIGLTFLWEPWDWGRRRQNVRAAGLGISQAENTLGDTRSGIIIEVNTAVRQILAARDDLVAARAAQTATRERARVMLNRYQQNLALLSETLQAQSAAAAADATYQEALSDYLTAQANLERAIGQEAEQ